jgi:replicative DNA helicase
MKEMPHSEEAERGLLGAALMEPQRVLGDVVGRIGVSAEDFYSPRNRLLFELLSAMHQKMKTIDLVTVSSIIQKNARLANLGGLEFLSELVDSTPTASHAEYYAEIILEKSEGRNVILKASEAIERITKGESPRESASQAVTELDKIIMSGCKGKSVEEINEGIEKGWDQTGIRSQFGDLKDMFRYEGMVILGAYPSVGKTALMVYETVGWCEAGMHIAGASLEMSEGKIRERMAASRSGVNTRWLYNGNPDARDKVRRALKEIASWKLTINDSGMTCDSFCAWARAMKSRGAQLVWLDYLQLFNCSGEEWKMPVEQRISMWSNKIKATQKAIEIPIIVLSQLSRPYQRDTSVMPPPPTLSSLRYSGSIEQDADAALLLFKDPDQDPSYYLQNQTWPEIIDIAKQRNGETGRINVWFERELQRFKGSSEIVKEVIVPQKKEKEFDW